MRVARENFKETLPKITDAISNADFVALDCEFSGIGGNGVLQYDLPDLVYRHKAQIARDHTIVQLGLCCFQYQKESDVYVYDAFSIYLFARPLTVNDREIKNWMGNFMCQSSALDFLANQDFDFNKWICSGVSYLQPEQYHKLVSEAEGRYGKGLKRARELSSRGPSVSVKTVANDSQMNVPDKLKPEINKYLKRVSTFWEDDSQTSMQISNMSLKVAQVVKEFIGKRHAVKLYARFTRDVGATQFGYTLTITKCQSFKEYVEFLDKEKQSDLDAIEEARGVTAIFETLVKGKKTLVGHNFFLDVLMLYQRFHGELPIRYQDFCDVVADFGSIYDTKVLVSQPPLKDRILKGKEGAVDSGSSLEALEEKFQELSGNKRVKLKAGKSSNSKETYHSPSSATAFHDAGFDAFVSGRVFLDLAFELAKIRGNGPPFSADIKWPFLESYENSVFVGRVLDMSIMDLRPEHCNTVPDRAHVFYVEMMTDLYNSSDIIRHFKPFGPAQMHWIDSKNAFVTLWQRQHAEAATKKLVGLAINGGRIKVQKVEAFLNDILRLGKEQLFRQGKKGNASQGEAVPKEETQERKQTVSVALSNETEGSSEGDSKPTKCKVKRSKSPKDEEHNTEEKTNGQEEVNGCDKEKSNEERVFVENNDWE